MTVCHSSNVARNRSFRIQVKDTVDDERPPRGRDMHHAAVHLEGRSGTPIIQENLDRLVTAGHLETVLNDFQTRMAAVMEEQIKNNMLFFQISPGREVAEPLKGKSQEGRPGTSRPPRPELTRPPSKGKQAVPEAKKIEEASQPKKNLPKKDETWAMTSMTTSSKRSRRSEPSASVEPIEFNKDQYSILMEIKDQHQLKAPAEMKTPYRNRDKSKYCHFHKDCGHETNECKHLKRALKDLARKGKMNSYLPSSGRKFQKKDNRQGRRKDDESTDEDVVMVISGGFAAGGPTTRGHKNYLRELSQVMLTNQAEADPFPKIVVSEQDRGKIRTPHDDPLVVEMKIANLRVRQILIDTGSSTDIISVDYLSRLKFDGNDLVPVNHTIIGFGGGSPKLKMDKPEKPTTTLLLLSKPLYQVREDPIQNERNTYESQHDELVILNEDQDREKTQRGKAFQDEVKKQLRLAGPLILVGLLTFSLHIISLMMVGHLGEIALSGASMATSFAYVTGFSLLLGMASALETICGQSYGAEQYHMVGIHTQRAMVLLLVISIPISVIWSYTETILVALGQDHKIAAEAAPYAQFMIPSLFAYSLLQCLIRFFQTQNIVSPMMLTSGITTLLHILICWMLVFKSGLGSKGAALANTISYWINCLLLALYVKFSSSFSRTWTGFCTASFQGIPALLRLAVPSAVMVCMEMWSFEMIVLLSGLLPNPSLETSVLSISLNTTSLFWVIPEGLSGAVSTRVSNELGAGNPQSARLAVYVVLCMTIFESIVVGLVLILIRNAWGYAYSSEIEVVTYLATMMPLLALTNFLDGLACVLSGVARGCCWQRIGAFINI
ncbi:hypothetical protein BVRB_5g126270 isoform A [Beta vulgaris subsp. vulgaris]|uniref:Protein DETOXIFICATION n=1 Tax=Beta vulgaris subsp. vulgaris TaxID=3555 RepID=A0A0J8BBX3_BETVV|nr:hypothetical protein BVRB_5g126270 isoform A [Beta vulgaris subsp. vulgaris]